jgi:hypothetical protein
VKQLGAYIGCEDVHETFFCKSKYGQNSFEIKGAYAP